MKKSWIYSLLFFAGSVYASQTKYVNLRGSDVFSKGDLNNIQLDVQGNLSLAPAIKELFDTKNLLITSAAKAPRGVYFSTAKDAGLFFYNIKTGKTKSIYENSQSLSIPSFALHQNHLYFIESPSRTLYSIDMSNPNDTPQKIQEIRVANYIWQMKIEGQYLYFATGAKAALYRIPLNKLNQTPEKIFEAPSEHHFLTMKIFGETVYLGGEGEGCVYAVDLDTKKSRMVYQTYEGNVSDIAQAKNGDIFIITDNKESKPTGKDFDYTDTFLFYQEKYQLAQAKLSDTEKNHYLSGGSAVTAGLSVKNSLYQIKKNGNINKLFTLEGIALNTLLLDEANHKILVGASNGRVFQWDAHAGALSLLATVDNEDVSQLVELSHSFLAMTSNIGQLYELGQELSKKGTYTSDIIDLGNLAKVGKTKIETGYGNAGHLRVWLRGGQNSEIDKNWTDWEGPLVSEETTPDMSKIHYLQYKVEMEGNGVNKSPILSRLLTSYLPDNHIPSISSFSVLYTEQQPMSPRQNLQIHWNASDADQDKLIYRVYFRRRGDISWSLLLESPNQDKMSLDTKVLPDGVYQFKLQVSDELDNSKDHVGKATQISHYILVSNMPPKIDIISVKNNQKFVTIHARVLSRSALIGKIYYKLGVESDWIFVTPDTGLYDSKKVDFTLQIPKKDLKNVENFIFIRAFDTNMQQIASRVRLNLLGVWLPDKENS